MDIYFIHGTSDPAEAGLRGLKHLIVKSIRFLYSEYLIKKAIEKCKHDSTIIVTSGYIYSRVYKLVPDSQKILNSDDFLRRFYQGGNVDNNVIFFMNNFFNVMEISPVVTDLRILEQRWVVPMTLRLSYIPFLQYLISTYNVSSINIIGFPDYLPFVIKFCSFKRVRTQRYKKYYIKLIDLFIKYKEKKFYKQMSKTVFIRNLFKKHNFSKNENFLNKNYFENKKLLVVLNYDRTAERLIALLPELKKDNWSITAICLRRVTLAEKIRKLGASVIYTDQLINHHDYFLCKNESKISKNLLNQFLNRRELQESFLYGCDLKSISLPYLKSLIPDALLVSKMAQLSVNKLYDADNYDLTLHFEDWELNHAVTFQGRKRNIPSLAYYCLSGVPEDTLFRRSQDWFAASGENLRTGYEKQFTRDKTRVVGDVLSTKSSDLTMSDKEELKKSFNIPKTKKIILLLATFPCPGVNLSEIELVFRRTFASAKKIPNAIVVVKAHPGQSIDALKSWMLNWNCSTEFIFQAESLTSLLQISDIVSTVATSAMFQALVCEVPVVCLQSKKSLLLYEFFGFDILSNKGVIHIDAEDSPDKIINDLIFDQSLRSIQTKKGLIHAETHLGPSDGKSSARLIKYMNDIINLNQL